MGKNNEIHWFIAGRFGLYYGSFPTRREAITEHCRALGIDWQTACKKGDRAIKCRVTPEATP